ncbi:MAG: MATE family efflux transporter [Acidobacteriota bacterium]|nr:MATE family efflux transporter [Acidobacteriota bacterium]
MLRELKPMLALAIPVVTAEIGWILMGIVDTIMVGPLGPAAIGAVGVGSTMFMTGAVFGIGLLMGLDTFVSQAYGAGRIQECHRWLFNGLALAVLFSVPLTLAVFGFLYLLPLLGFHDEVLVLIVPYVGTVLLSTLPLMIYAAFRRYLQAMNVVGPVMVALLSANLVNAAANYVLIFGHFGFPAMGVVGAAWGTVIGRVYLAIFLLLVIVRRERRQSTGLHDVSMWPERDRLVKLFRLGLPAAMQITVEVGVFAAASALAGGVGPAAVAAHQIALNLASFMFMIPFGMASAGAVRVGQAIGRGDVHGVRVAGQAALLIGAGFMAGAGLLFVLMPRPLLHLFTRDPEVIAIGLSLLAIAAIFQLFDGVQAVSTGLLRGLGDTRTAMLCHVFGHWAVGLPLGYALCFWWGWGVPGLWTGLSTGLILIGIVLVTRWFYRARHLRVETMTMA